MFSKVLFVGAHPDDLEINAGGTINKLINSGREVFCWVLATSNNKEEQDVRFTEGLKALMLLGVPVDNITIFKGGDTELQNHFRHRVVELESFLKDSGIKSVFTHHYGDSHQDHKATYNIVEVACRDLNNLLMFTGTYPSGRMNVPAHLNYSVSLSSSNIDAKISALKAHHSQCIKYGGELWVQSIASIVQGDAWRYRGFHGAVELFQVSRLSIDKF